MCSLNASNIAPTVNYSMGLIQKQNVAETNKASLQQISRTSVLIRGRSETTWNSLREVMGQDDLKTIKHFTGAGWIVLISDLQKVIKTAQRRNIKIIFDQIPKFVRDIQQPFDFDGYQASVLTPEILKSRSLGTQSSKPLISIKQERSLLKLPIEVRKNLFKFQAEGIEFGVKLNCRLLIADEMGAGKTIQALCLAYLYKDEWPLLIICPSCLRLTFRQEILQWFSKQIDESQIQVINKGADKLLKSSLIVIMSFDIVPTFKEVIEIKQFQTCIIDEAHYLKSLDSLRSLHIVPLVQKMKNVILLTGTPAMSKPRELFNILTILRPNIFKEFRVYGTRYCDPKIHPFYQSVSFDGCDNKEELNYLMNEGLMIRRLKADILPDLPEKRRKKVIIEISKTSRRELKSLVSKADLIKFNSFLHHQLENFDETSKVQIQDSSHAAFNQNFNKMYIRTGMAKLEGLKDYIVNLLESKSKLIIFAHHKCVINEIEKMITIDLGLSAIRIDGEVSSEERMKRVSDFQVKEDPRVAILSIQAASHGITMTASSHVIFAELYPVPAIMLQAEDRSHRVNQKSTVLCHYVIAKDTIDERIFSLLQSKFEITSSVIDGQKQSLCIHEQQVIDYDSCKLVQLSLSFNPHQNICPIEQKSIITTQKTSQISVIDDLNNHKENIMIDQSIHEENNNERKEVNPLLLHDQIQNYKVQPTVSNFLAGQKQINNIDEQRFESVIQLINEKQQKNNENFEQTEFISRNIKTPNRTLENQTMNNLEFQYQITPATTCYDSPKNTELKSGFSPLSFGLNSDSSCATLVANKPEEKTKYLSQILSLINDDSSSSSNDDATESKARNFENPKEENDDLSQLIQLSKSINKVNKYGTNLKIINKKSKQEFESQKFSIEALKTKLPEQKSQKIIFKPL